MTSAGSEKQRLRKRFLLPLLALVNTGCVVVCKCKNHYDISIRVAADLTSS